VQAVFQKGPASKKGGWSEKEGSGPRERGARRGAMQAKQQKKQDVREERITKDHTIPTISKLESKSHLKSMKSKYLRKAKKKTQYQKRN